MIEKIIVWGAGGIACLRNFVAFLNISVRSGFCEYTLTNFWSNRASKKHLRKVRHVSDPCVISWLNDFA